METLSRMNMVVVKKYYHMTIMDENVSRMTFAHLLLKFSLSIKALFCTSSFILKQLLSFLNVHTREK